jgi:class 3 adenylate cyclase/pimeloyl-ACP methyl ester carboxylesterase
VSGVPKTNYASVGDAQIAYQVLGQDPPAPALVQVTGSISHVEERWGSRLYADSLKRLASFSRVIAFDPRGSGLSDPLPPGTGAPWESWTEDLQAVLDDVGCERAGILAGGEAGPSAILFAAIYPERTSALFLVNTAARYLVADDYPCGVTEEIAAMVVAAFREGWGSEGFAALTTPSMAADPSYYEWASHFQRSSATPRAAAAQLAAVLQGDVRDSLPLIQAPTVVFHRSPSYRFVPIAMGRYLADHIPGSRFVELPGEDSWIFSGTSEGAYDLIEETLTGGRKVRESERVFATVLVEDIVASTERAVAMGDGAWKGLLDRHDETVEGVVASLRGRVVKRTGDGVVVIFDSPSRAIRCAQQLREEIRAFGLDIRVGAHAGEIERRGEDVAGVGVHTAARVSALAEPGEVLVSRTVTDLVAGSGIDFNDRGEHELKGVPGTWQLLAVAG